MVSGPSIRFAGAIYYWRVRDPALVAVYEAAVFDVEFPNCRCSFDRTGQLNGRPVHEPFGGITAWNPGKERLPREANEAANARLAASIDARGWRRLPAVGRDAAGAYAEPSFAVFGAGQAELVHLARQFRQEAIFWWDGAFWRVVWS